MSDLTDSAGSVVRPEDAVTTAVLACPGVVHLHSGGLRPVTTHLPGRRIEGVRMDDTVVEVAVVAAYGVPVTVLSGRIRGAVAPLAAGRPIDIYVADVVLPRQAAEEPAPAASTSDRP